MLGIGLGIVASATAPTTAAAPTASGVGAVTVVLVVVATPTAAQHALDVSHWRGRLVGHWSVFGCTSRTGPAILRCLWGNAFPPGGIFSPAARRRDQTPVT